jgi:hypothetical protein
MATNTELGVVFKKHAVGSTQKLPLEEMQDKLPPKI